MLPSVTRPASTIGGSALATSPMAASKQRRYMTPDPISLTTTLNDTPSAAVVPSLDLSVVRPETNRRTTTTAAIGKQGWESDATSRAAHSAVSPKNRRSTFDRQRKPVPPPGGSARERGKFGGGGGVGGGAGGGGGVGSNGGVGSKRHKKWMSKSILEIRRANERATNPYSPLYKRARAKRSTNNNNEKNSIKIHHGHVDMNNVTNRLHDTLSLAQLEKESVAMLTTKEKNVSLLRMRHDRLVSKATKKEKLYHWSQKEIKRIKLELGELKSLSDEADNSPEVVSIKSKLQETTIAADREESYTYVMRLLTNRARHPLKSSTKRLELLKKELIGAEKELFNLKARSHRLNEKMDSTLLEKNNLEQQSKDLLNIYLMKAKTLKNVEKQRENQKNQDEKQEEERMNLFHVLHGDRGEEEENRLRKGLLRGVMKGKAVNARANILQKTNDELNSAFEKMMEVAADHDVNSVCNKFMERGTKTNELNDNLIHLQKRLMKAKNRNNELNKTLLEYQLEYANPLNDRRLQHECDLMETSLHKLTLSKTVEGEKLLHVKIHLQRTKECFENLLIVLKSCQEKQNNNNNNKNKNVVLQPKHNTKKSKQTMNSESSITRERSVSRQRVQGATAAPANAPTNMATLDTDWPYSMEQQKASKVPPSLKVGPLPIPKFDILHGLLKHVTHLTKYIMNGLHKNERNAYLHHHHNNITHFMSGAAALHRSNEKGLVMKESSGNCRVAYGLSPDQEIFMSKMLEKSGMKKSMHKNISSRIQVSISYVVAIFSWLIVCFIIHFLHNSCLSIFFLLLLLSAGNDIKKK